jgi:hypothetical protein
MLLPPWWGKFGGVNDRLAIMGSKPRSITSTPGQVIDQLLAAGCPFHPETLVMESMRLGGTSRSSRA